MQTITHLLVRMQSGDPQAASQAMEAVYGDLHRLAGSYMRREGNAYTLQPTALVHEAYLRLVGSDADFQSRRHFLVIAAQTMRRILVDHAREKRAAKRGGGAIQVEIEDFHASQSSQNLDVLAVDECLRELARKDPRAAKVVELRFFGGYTDKEVAEILDEKLATLRADWDFAKAWIRSRLQTA